MRIKFKVANSKLFSSEKLQHWGLKTTLKWPGKPLFKIVQHYGLGEGYKKLSQRFQLSVSTGRNIVRKWKTTCTVLVKDKSAGTRKILERQRRRMMRGWCHCASFNNSAHFAQGEAVWESDAKEALSAHTPQSQLRYAKAYLDKPTSFWKKVLSTDETKIKLFGHNKGRGGERTQHSKKNICYPRKNFVEVPSCCWAVWTVPVLGVLLKLRVAWIPLNISRFLRIMFKSQSSSYAGAGYFNKTTNQNTAQNLLRHSCRGTSTLYWNGHPSPRSEYHWKSVGWFEMGRPCLTTINPNWTRDVL